MICDVCGSAVVAVGAAIRDQHHFCDVCLQFRVLDCERIRNHGV